MTSELNKTLRPISWESGALTYHAINHSSRGNTLSSRNNRHNTRRLFVVRSTVVGIVAGHNAVALYEGDTGVRHVPVEGVEGEGWEKAAGSEPVGGVDGEGYEGAGRGAGRGAVGSEPALQVWGVDGGETLC